MNKWRGRFQNRKAAVINYKRCKGRYSPKAYPINPCTIPLTQTQKGSRGSEQTTVFCLWSINTLNRRMLIFYYNFPGGYPALPYILSKRKDRILFQWKHSVCKVITSALFFFYPVLLYTQRIDSLTMSNFTYINISWIVSVYPPSPLKIRMCTQ